MICMYLPNYSITGKDMTQGQFYTGPLAEWVECSPGDLGSIPGRVIPKTQKIVFDAALLNTQHYKVRIKSKVEQSKVRSSALPYTLV